MKSSTAKLYYVRYIFVTLLATAAWSSSYPVMRHLALDNSNPYVVAFGRAFYSMAILLAFLLALRKPPSFKNFRANWRILLGMGATGVAGMFLSLTIGLQYAGAGKCTLINSINPALIVVLAHFILKEPLNRRRSAGVALSLAGLLLVITGNDLHVWYNLSFVKTDLFFILSGACWAVYAILNRFLGYRIYPLEGLFWIFACAVVLLSPAALIFAGDLRLFAGQNGLWLVYLGLVPGAAGNFLWYKGIMVVGASAAGLINSFLPMFTIVIAYFTLGEVLTPAQLAGMVVLTLGVWLGIIRKEEAVDGR